MTAHWKTLGDLHVGQSGRWQSCCETVGQPVKHDGRPVDYPYLFRPVFHADCPFPGDRTSPFRLL